MLIIAIVYILGIFLHRTALVRHHPCRMDDGLAFEVSRPLVIRRYHIHDAYILLGIGRELIKEVNNPMGIGRRFG